MSELQCRGLLCKRFDKDTDFSGNPGMMIMSICNIITTKECLLKLVNGWLKYKKLVTKLYME